MYFSDGRQVLSVSTDGEVHFGEGCTTKEASRVFWNALAEHPKKVDAALVNLIRACERALPHIPNTVVQEQLRQVLLTSADVLPTLKPEVSPDGTVWDRIGRD